MWSRVLSRRFLVTLIYCSVISIIFAGGTIGTAATDGGSGKAAAAQRVKQPTPKYGGVWRRGYDSDARQLGNPVARPFDTSSIKMSPPGGRKSPPL